MIGDMASAKVALGGALVGLAGVACGPLAHVPRSLAPLVHICHLFAHFCYIFLHTNNSISTSGTR
jgi:hypothetical protein